MKHRTLLAPKLAGAVMGLTVLAGAVGAARADTITQTQNFSFGPPVPGFGDVQTGLFFNTFNPALGTLTDVEFSLSSNVQIFNLGPSNPFFLGTVDASVGVYGLATLAGNTWNSVQSPWILPFNSSFTGVSNPSLPLSYYAQPGPYFELSLFLGDSDQLTTPGWAGTLTLTYDYTPATPLPAALPLFATGLGGLGLLGWRRKRKAQAVA